MAQFGQKQDVLANTGDCVSRNNATVSCHAIKHAVAFQSAECTLKHDERVTQSHRSQSQSLYDPVGGARWVLFTVLELESTLC